VRAKSEAPGGAGFLSGEAGADAGRGRLSCGCFSASRPLPPPPPSSSGLLPPKWYGSGLAERRRGVAAAARHACHAARCVARLPARVWQAWQHAQAALTPTFALLALVCDGGALAPPLILLDDRGELLRLVALRACGSASGTDPGRVRAPPPSRGSLAQRRRRCQRWRGHSRAIELPLPPAARPADLLRCASSVMSIWAPRPARAACPGSAAPGASGVRARARACQAAHRSGWRRGRASSVRSWWPAIWGPRPRGPRPRFKTAQPPPPASRGRRPCVFDNSAARHVARLAATQARRCEVAKSMRAQVVPPAACCLLRLPGVAPR
jgi:hypothetical protein